MENDTNIPSNATDGNDSTRWGATQNGFANMIVDLGAVYELTDIITLFENASWNYTIAISVDGEAYTVIHEGEPHGANSVKIHSDEPVEVRYIKYTRLEDGNEGAHWFSIYEVIAHGTLKDEAPASQLVHVSNDELRIMATDNATQIGAGFTPGQFAAWENKVVTLEEGSYGCLIDWGWAAFNSETFQFGYIINGVEIFADAFTFATEQGVLDAAANAGASNASRFCGVCAAAALPVGENNVKFAVMLDGGEVCVLREYTVIITAAA